MRERPAKSSSGHGVDRLSALPDALLHCVMSYLTARQAVQTCTLSRRWRNLWRSAPSLDVDSHMDDKPKSGAVTAAPPALSEMQWEKFTDFAIRLLQHHSAPILDRFRLRISTYRHGVKEQVVRWILRGASYRPATLEISLHFAASYARMPPLGTTTTSSRLTRLCLSGVLLDGGGDGFAGCLRTGGCPVLQDLELKDCAFDDFEEIVSGTLRSLTLYGCTAKRRLDAEKWRVRVTAPCLVSIAIGWGWWNVITLSTPPQVKAERIVSTTNEIMLIIL